MTVAVIGAGIAGLACARALQKRGFDVCVLDKARGPGGRLTTSRGDAWQADMGAQYFTARDSGFQRELEVWLAQGVATRWQPRLVWLDGNGTEPVEPGTSRYVGTPRMSAITRYLASNLDVRGGARIEGASRGEGGIQLRDAEGGVIGVFRQLVVAVPAPQAAPLLETLAPDLAVRAGRAVMRPCWTLIVEPRESLGLPFDAAFVRETPLGWLARDGSKPGRAGQVWVMHADGAWSQEHVDAPAEQVQETLLGAFQRLTGCATVPLVRRLHRWRYAATADNLGESCLLEPGGEVGVCGDWCLGNRVEAAWLSGRALAEAMINAADPS